MKNNMFFINKLYFWTIFILCMSYSSLIYGASDEDTEAKYSEAAFSVKQSENIKHVIPKKSGEDKVSFKGYVDVQQGFDNNVNLNSKRQRDGYFQSIANAEIKCEPTNIVDIKAGLDVFSINYYNLNTNNILDLMPYLEADFDFIPKKLKFKNKIGFDYFSYTNKKESSHSSFVYTTSLRHFILERVYHEPAFEYYYRYYPDKKINLNSGASGEHDREDSRWKVKYTLGLFGKRFLFKLKNELYKNDSNNEYQEYYDYWVYRVKPSLVYFFTNKFYTNTGYSYRYTCYEDRRSTDDNDKTVTDGTHRLTTTLYYDLTKNTTCSISYSYAENLSNDPYQRYSGGTVSGGISYSF